MTTRRGFLGAILAAGVAPAYVGSSVLMPVKKIAAPDLQFFGTTTGRWVTPGPVFQEFPRAKIFFPAGTYVIDDNFRHQMERVLEQSERRVSQIWRQHSQ